jgi:hypothetical protein
MIEDEFLYVQVALLCSLSEYSKENMVFQKLGLFPSLTKWYESTCLLRSITLR